MHVAKVTKECYLPTKLSLVLLYRLPILSAPSMNDQMKFLKKTMENYLTTVFPHIASALE